MVKTNVIERLKEIFESTIESDLKYDGSIENIDYYNLFCKAAAQDKLYRILGNNLCMYNCSYNNKDAVMLIFFIPINMEDSGVKNVAERIIDVVEKIEICFITLDYLKSQEVKEDKFIYIVAIKTI